MLAVLFKTINLLFITHTIKSDRGKLPTLMLAYILSYLMFLNACFLFH